MPQRELVFFRSSINDCLSRMEGWTHPPRVSISRSLKRFTDAMESQSMHTHPQRTPAPPRQTPAPPHPNPKCLCHPLTQGDLPTQQWSPGGRDPLQLASLSSSCCCSHHICVPEDGAHLVCIYYSFVISLLSICA